MQSNNDPSTHRACLTQPVQGMPDQRALYPQQSWWQHTYIGYMACALPILAAFLISWLETFVDIHDYFIGILFALGTFLIAWVWGTKPGVVALVVGLLCTDYLSIPPIRTFTFDLWPGLISLLPYMIIQFLFVWLIARQKRYQAHLLLARQEAAQYAEYMTENNNRLAQADRVKDQFLSVASHELRTPVTSMHGYIQLLLRRLKKQDGQTQEWHAIHDALLKIDEQIKRLVSLINDLLDINRLRSGHAPLHRELGDLRDLCHRVVEAQQVGAERVIDLRLPPEAVMAHFDQERLAQVLLNLVSNALKYSSPQTIVTIELVKQPDQAILTVHNEGPVLSQEQQQQIFEPFYRSPQARASATVGWGLGLAISKELTEQHGGSLWVRSSAEGGTTFGMTLPL
jgi:signal transduction histidine kinase